MRWCIAIVLSVAVVLLWIAFVAVMRNPYVTP